jgi:hypothetical protein
MTDTQKDIPGKEETPVKEETSPEKKEEGDKQAPKDSTKYDGGAIRR